jgi:hypothetical protein
MITYLTTHAHLALTRILRVDVVRMVFVSKPLFDVGAGVSQRSIQPTGYREIMKRLRSVTLAASPHLTNLPKDERKARRDGTILGPFFFAFRIRSEATFI